MRALLVLTLLTSLPGCLAAGMGAGAAVTHGSADRERGAGGLFHTAAVIEAPAKNRCEGRTSSQRSCDEALYLATLYARRLATGDDVCLEGGMGERTVGRDCQARAFVADSDTGRVLLEIRDAQPTSKWSSRIQHQVWFEEGAIVDAYLADHGY